MYQVHVQSSNRNRRYRPSDPALFSRTEAAAFVGVSLSTLAHWAMIGRGPIFRRIGRSCYYHIADLKAWIANPVDGEGKHAGLD